MSSLTTGTISSPGIGSDLDVSGIVSGLMAVQSAPLTQLANQEAAYEAELSAYGTLSSALSAFQTAMQNLSSASSFQALTTNVGNDDVLSATADTTAVPGSYQVNVTQLAQAQILSTTGQANATDAIGSGTPTTISFQFGQITGGTLTDGTYSGATFTQDPTQPSGTVTINSSNNSLQGIRDAINSANLGVTATIVSDGSSTPDHLVLTSNQTGQTSSMKITVSGDSTLQNLLSYDPAGTQDLTQNAAAQNTQLTVNGINITSATSTVSGAIQGVTLNVAQTGSTSVSVAQDTSTVTANVNAFVNAYNALNSQLDSLTAFTPSTAGGTTAGTAGPLLGDPTTQTLQDSIRNTLSSSLAGLSNSNLSLASIGISFNSDGSMSLDSDTLQSALSSNFNDIASLFSTIGTTSDSLVKYTSSSASTKAGSYDVNITQMATQGAMTGNTDLTTGSTTIAPNTELSVTIDGVSTKVALTAGTFTASQLATMVQSSINSASAIKSAGSSVTASIDANGDLQVVSNRYGSASNVTIQDGTGTPASTLFGTVTQGTAGVDVAGTIGGIQATGSGQYLTGATGTAIDGLKIQITGGSTGDRGTINFSQGYAQQLSQLSSTFLGSSGLIASVTNGINSSITDINNQTDALNQRLQNVQANYEAEFTNLDVLLSNLQSTQSYLTTELASLAANTASSSSSSS